jgi:leucyl aminopeptidase
LIDFATLTGSARVALGPDLAALFANDDALAGQLLAAGESVEDPLWRLPLWPGYAPWLDSRAADLGNVAANAHAGAVVAALFLQRFVSPAIPWAHIDLYAWNDQTRPGRPEGGEATAMRAVFQGLRARFGAGAA